MPAATSPDHPRGAPSANTIADQIAEAQEKVIASAYDYATVYTTVIIFGGYAGFFAVWQLTKDYLSKPQALWAALLVLISLLSFILFEVYKMVLVTTSVLKQRKILDTPAVRGNPQKLLAALRAMEHAQKPSQRWFIIAWAIIVAIALATALGGTGVLAFAFITGLSK